MTARDIKVLDVLFARLDDLTRRITALEAVSHAQITDAFSHRVVAQDTDFFRHSRPRKYC